MKKLILFKQSGEGKEVIENITNDITGEEIKNVVNGIKTNDEDNAPSHFLVEYEEDGYICERLVRGLEVEDAILMTKKVEG